MVAIFWYFRYRNKFIFKMEISKSENQVDLLSVTIKNKPKEIKTTGLTGVAQRVERPPTNRKLLVRSWSGHMPGLQARFPFGGLRDNLS